jgi:hypothetical protein
MSFKLKAGSVCRLNAMIPGIHKSDSWRTGLYRVIRIHSLWACGPTADDPRQKSYLFEKIKKDGTVYKSFCNGYNCQAWDGKIDAGEVEIVNL